MTGVTFRDERPDPHEPYRAHPDRFKGLSYRYLGSSGLLLPPLSLGCWYNFGDNIPFDRQRQILRHAFDHGINHIDLANNYGPPPGSAEENIGRALAKDLRPYRNELVISTKAGWPQWLGPNGRLGSRKYLLTSLDESLQRLGTDYVDIFYSHRYDPDTPLAETIGALDAAVRSGKALYAGISSYSVERTREALEIADRLGTPIVAHQPAYSLLNRWVEGGLTELAGGHGFGLVAFSPLGQGLLTDKYLSGPAGVERATARPTFLESFLDDENLGRVRGLDEIARRRGQTLAQLALAWVLRDPRVTTAVIGVSSVAQLDENLKALENLSFSDDELTEIDRFAVDAGINLWSISSEL